MQPTNVGQGALGRNIRFTASSRIFLFPRALKLKCKGMLGYLILVFNPRASSTQSIKRVKAGNKKV